MFFPKTISLKMTKNIKNVIFLSFQNYCENLKFFWKFLKNRKISKCSKIDYFSSIFLKRACDRNEMILCRFLAKNNFGKLFEKFSNPRKIIKNQHFFTNNRRCAWCATCVHIRHTCFRASKNKTSASYLFNKPYRTSGRHILTILLINKNCHKIEKMWAVHDNAL